MRPAWWPHSCRGPFAGRFPKRCASTITETAWKLLESGVPFAEAMQETYKSILCSPHFLFLEEAPGKLDGYALASRLSYFLWNSMPDDDLARRGGSRRLAAS